MSGTTEQFVFFWQSGSPFSQWYPCQFTVDEIAFNCAEQYMMYGKALLFANQAVAQEILDSPDPKHQKALGRKVKDFDNQVWKDNREKIVYQGNFAKFTQNQELLELLLATSGKTLVEASPYDRIWGIGLKESDSRAKDRNQWRGQNLLGEILTRLREDLLSAE